MYSSYSEGIHPHLSATRCPCAFGDVGKDTAQVWGGDYHRYAINAIKTSLKSPGAMCMVHVIYLHVIHVEEFLRTSQYIFCVLKCKLGIDAYCVNSF
jgi:hypothetical protein